MKRFFAIALIVSLAGCASLNNAGTAEYTVRPFLDQSGGVHCCEVRVVNGKEIASLDAHISKEGDNYTVDLKERGVQAFGGQAIAAGATESAIAAAAKAAAAAALTPVIPLLLPAAGTALAAPGIGAAAVGAAGVIAVDKVKP